MLPGIFLAGFPSTFGLLAWCLFWTTRDQTALTSSLGSLVSLFSTGLEFLFLGRQGQLGMWVSSCLGFPLTSGGSGRIWGAWRPLVILLSQRAESLTERTGAVDWISQRGQVARVSRESMGIRTIVEFLKNQLRVEWIGGTQGIWGTVKLFCMIWQ